MSPVPEEGAPAAFTSQKRAALLLLKRRGELSLAEIAGGLRVSRVAALRHLVSLEGDGLVERSYRPEGVGRPRAYFRVSDRAAPMFPQAYADMSRCALEFIEERLGHEAVLELLQRRARELEDANRERFRMEGLPERVRELAKLRREGGYMAELGPHRQASMVLLEHNCPVLAIADRFPEACDTERRMFESLLRARVDVRHRLAAGDPVCRFLVRARSAR